MTRPPPKSPLFPYPTLFRSDRGRAASCAPTGGRSAESPGLPSLCLRCLGGFGLGGLALGRRALRAVAAEQPRGRELAELVAHHVLRDVHGDELVPVVNRQRMTHEIGRDDAAPRPRLEHLLLALLVQDPDLLEERGLHVVALLDGPYHYCVAFPRLRPRTMSFVDDFFLCRVFFPSTLPQGEVGGRPPEVLPSPPPSGWSTGFIATPRTRGWRPSQRLLPALPMDRSSCSALETSPIVARQSPRTMRISLDPRRRVT